MLGKLKDLILDAKMPWIEINDDDLPVWVIGDVHGCADEYEELLKQIMIETPYCHIYQLGDLIDRGPFLYEVFELSNNFGVKTLIGNHEINFFQELITGRPVRSRAREISHKIFMELSVENQEFIKVMIARSYNRACVYSNNRWWTLSHSLPRVINDFHDVVNAPDMCMGADNVEYGMALENHIHGHMHWKYEDIMEQKKKSKGSFLFNIDSGCVYGEKLTAIELASLQVIQVDGFDYVGEVVV